jgi:LacI family transcriptional regulator
MEDVARIAGVSRTTVSLVLNEKPDHGIPAHTVDRIHEAAASLGYRRNAMAAGLRSSTTDTIGLISDVVATTPFAGQMLHGAQEVAWAAHKLISVINTEGDPEVEDAAIAQVLERRMDGALWATMYHQVIPRPRGLDGLPVVLLDARTDDGSLPSVVPDDLGGARAAVAHLVEAGHRRIGFINQADPVPAAVLRLQGYREILAEAGIGADPALVVEGDGTPGGEQAGLALLALPDRPTAIFCFNDRTAMGLLRACRRLGLSVPGDVSVVGYDNHEVIAPWMDPPLTTVQLPHLEMGRWGTEHLLALIEGRVPAGDPPVQMRMPCPLVIRSSVAAPRR